VPDVADLVLGDPAHQRRGSVIADRGVPDRPRDRVIEVRLLEPEPEADGELERRLAAAQRVPQETRQGLLAELDPQLSHPREVHPEVPLLLRDDRQHSPPKRFGSVRPAPESPAEQLDRLQLVVREDVEGTAAVGVGPDIGGKPRSAARQPEPGWTARRRDRAWRRPEVEVARRRRCELVFERSSEHPPLDHRREPLPQASSHDKTCRIGNAVDEDNRRVYVHLSWAQEPSGTWRKTCPTSPFAPSRWP
jgi:hypothetical protein